MLTRIDLASFKCFQELCLPLRPLTLLTGRNASGKSTVLQALVLLHQTMFHAEWSDELHLNGDLLSLGTAADLIDQISGKRTCGLTLSTAQGHCQWRFKSRDRGAMNIRVEDVAWTSEVGEQRTYQHQAAEISKLRYLMPAQWSEHTPALRELADIMRTVQYISAERLGPRELYPLVDPKRRTIGAYGQHAPALLFWLDSEPVADALVLQTDTPTLRNQVQAWMREFFPGCGIDVQAIRNANHVSLGIRTSDETDYHRPQHVGFGLTHILPIITAALAARPSQVLLIENPEVHLHPAGQSQMGQFLARVAATGVQIIIETHSDHVLNGLRRAVRNKMISPDQAAIYFFNERARAQQGQVAQVVSPLIDHEGNLDHWPEGFFDQFDQDMNFFAGWE